MDFFRKSGTLYNLIILIVFLLFTRYQVNDSVVNEMHKKGDIIEFVQLISCSVEYINPNVDRAHNQVLPLVKLFSEKHYSSEIPEFNNNLSSLVRLSGLMSLSTSTRLEKICKFQI